MDIPSEFKNKTGIYRITNTINNKVYVGKAKNIYTRLKAHINYLNKKSLKQENPHFIHAWHKYGEEVFVCDILEECSITETTSKELYWITLLNSTDSEKGYNKRLDSSTGLITHPETREKLSKATSKRYNIPENREKISLFFKNFWANNPDKKQQMIDALKTTKKKKWMFLQMDEEENVIKIYDSVEDIILENPTYKWQNIYSVCNGYKKRIYGYKWAKKLKI